LLNDGILPRALVKNYKQAKLSHQDRVMLDYAVKLTHTPAEIEELDVVLLRETGFSDTAILDICQITAYYNYVNRLADGLGVELEDGWDEKLVVTEEEFMSWMDKKDYSKGSL
tara:strand:- start:540 stop:878 length:339 start_codon:yes stop_codon:yes gene_type:complete